MTRTAAAIALVALLAVGCAEPTGGAVSGSGIRGRILAGPQCPVVIENSPCPDVPVQATVVVRTLDGEEVASVRSDDDGAFQISLAPGTYDVVAEEFEGGMFAKPQTVTVEEGAFTDVVVSVDTGIR